MNEVIPVQVPAGLTAAVVGGARGMGLWIAKLLIRHGVKTSLLDIIPKTAQIASDIGAVGYQMPNTGVGDLPLEDGKLPVDVLVVAVPLDAVESAIRLYAPYLRPGA